eukprot:TRINITY_DN40588_c0_g1_i1.p1 TRINITY_DN40588_c0_g1~~TRINITY_DN40588_c0_g1_i1.p1  ORF type:complete len:336 (+),score=50.95 TRINITY_DN40588_c0_g1_i1:58-1065(+)
MLRCTTLSLAILSARFSASAQPSACEIGGEEACNGSALDDDDSEITSMKASLIQLKKQPSEDAENRSEQLKGSSQLLSYNYYHHYNCYDGHGGYGSQNGFHASLEECASHMNACFVYFFKRHRCFLRDHCNAEAQGCDFGVEGHESWEFSTFIKKPTNRDMSWYGRLRWYGSSRCQALGLEDKRDAYIIGLQDCDKKEDDSKKHLWQNNVQCGNVVEMFQFGQWENYWGVIEHESDAQGGVEVGNLFAVRYPGLPVPCHAGAQVKLSPPPAPDSDYGEGCMSKPSAPFQIRITSGRTKGCVTVERDDYYTQVKVRPCSSWFDNRQLFTLQWQGCD